MEIGTSPPSADLPGPALRDSVVAQLIERHYRGYPRALVIASLFAVLSMWLLRNVLPPAFLWVWLLAFIGVNAVRLAAASRFLAAGPEERLAPRWPVIAVVGHAAGGGAWGALCAGTVILRPEMPEYLMVSVFVIVVFAVFQATNPSRYPAAYYAWIGCAMVPGFLAALLHGGEVYLVLTALGVLFLATVSIVARSTQRMQIEATGRELERARLMQSLTWQKDALDEANRAKTRFLAAASHDLRQPMQAITLLVENLDERVHEPATREVVENIRTSVTTMAAMLNAILDISKFDAGVVQPERSHFPLGPTLERLRVAHAQSCAEKGISLEVIPTSAVVQTDAVLLYRILSNLAANAVRYTEHGRVVFGVRRRHNGVAIEIWDTGPGIPEHQQREIFREFVQLNNAQRDREQGLGLGLAIVERTAKVLGHKVSVRSQPGKGSVFTIEVTYGDPAKVTAATMPEAAPLEGVRVLVIDDQREVREAMTVLLRGWGCEVHPVASAAAAREALALLEGGPDVVISDYRLPDENGVAVPLLTQ